MEWYEALVFLLGMILFFMALGIPVALAFLAANMIGAAYFMGGRGAHHGRARCPSRGCRTTIGSSHCPTAIQVR